MIAVRVGEGGGHVTLENLTHRGVFADFERQDGTSKRIVLEPREVRRIAVAEGHVYITTSPGVLVK